MMGRLTHGETVASRGDRRHQMLIRTLKYKTKTTKHMLLDKWEYKKKNWITDFLWNTLHWFGCLSNLIEDEYIVYTAEVKHNDLSEAIFDIIRSIRSVDIKPTHVYMGYDEFDKFCSGKYAQNMYINFNLPIGHDMKIYDMPVTVVPHMKGFLVV